MADIIDALGDGLPAWVSDYLRGNEPPLLNISPDTRNFLDQVRDNPTAWSPELFRNTLAQLNPSVTPAPTTTTTVPPTTTTTTTPTTTTTVVPQSPLGPSSAFPPSVSPTAAPPPVQPAATGTSVPPATNVAPPPVAPRATGTGPAPGTTTTTTTTIVPSTSTGSYQPGVTAQVLTPDQVRAMFQDATSQYYGSYSQIVEYLADEEARAPGSTGVYGDFTAYENLPDYAWKSNGYTFTEFNQLPFQLPSEMIYALNQSFIAAGMYQQGYKPSDMRNGADPVFLETFRRLSAESFVRKQAPGEVLTGYVDRHVANVEARLQEFDQTNLAVQMDNIARSVIGRTLTADEFAAVRDQMAMFATPVEEQITQPGSTLAADITSIEEGNIPPEISARLQANIERNFQAEALQQRTYVAASRFGQDFLSYLSGRGVPSAGPTTPEFVTQTVEAES